MTYSDAEIWEIIEGLEEPYADKPNMEPEAARALRQLLEERRWHKIEDHPRDDEWFLGGWWFQGRFVYRLGKWNDRMTRFQEMPSCHKEAFDFFTKLPTPPQDGGA